MRRLLLSCLLLALAAQVVGAQVPGAYPHLTIIDENGTAIPPAGGPYNNSWVVEARAGSPIILDISYAALSQPNQNVSWGLLLSLQQTSFPTFLNPPPLFTQPPFQLLLGPMLDPTGHATLPLTVPAGLFDARVYTQAITFDSTSIPNLQLSNGVRVDSTLPRFNAAISYVRAAPGLTEDGLQGVSSQVLDGDTLPTLMPLGPNQAPDTKADDIGLAPGFRFLPIRPNVGDTPVNPMEYPFARLTRSMTLSPAIDEVEVDDASFFPPEGSLYIQQGGENPYLSKTNNGANSPNLERLTYTSIEIDEVTGRHVFKGVKRVQLGSTGSGFYPHVIGELVFGGFTWATTAGARARTRVSLDVTNREMPHVVIPAWTAEIGEETVTRDQDVYRFRETDSGREGFMLLDRVSNTWRILDDTVIDDTSDRTWNEMIAVAPDGRSMIAAQRVSGGPHGWDSNPDELYAIRLDGLNWPGSSSEVRQITFELQPEPEADDVGIRSREIWMESVAIMGPDPENYVAYVGLKYKWQQSQVGNNLIEDEGFEGFWIREEVLVRDYIELALVPPGSTKSPATLPRNYITGDFGTTGTGGLVIRFDPAPFLDHEGVRIFMAAGTSEKIEDMFVIRNFSVGSDGEVSRIIQNISGSGVVGGLGDAAGEIIAFDEGGAGLGNRVALSPDGSRIAWVRAQTVQGDFVQYAATNGADFSGVPSVYKDPSNNKFQEPGAYPDRHIINGLFFADEDNLVFLMGFNPHNDPIGEDNPLLGGLYDIFRYTISTDTMVNLSFTSDDPDDFGSFGTILPAATFKSPNGKFMYVVRDGRTSDGASVLNEEVVNILGVDLESFEVFDVVGDEFSPTTVIPNFDVPRNELLAPVEAPAGMQFTEGSGIQSSMMYLTAHLEGDNSQTDELLGFDRDSPFVTLQLTEGSPTGSHITNVSPNPYSSSVFFARTNDSDRYGVTQHPFGVDLDNFLFQRDMAPTFSMGGVPLGRVVDGSIHFVPPTGGAGDALIFSAGSSVVPGSFGIALDTSTVYSPLVNLSDPLLEPVPVLVPLLDTNNLGMGYQVFVVSAGAGE